MLHQSASRGQPLSLMILDIDYFKRVNDSYGHKVGDEVLTVFAQRVKSVIRQADLMCRLGGEEFVVVMPDTQLDIAAKIAERVRADVQSGLFIVEGGECAIPVTVSIGIAESGKESDPDLLFKRADRALYRSKNDGRNRVTPAAA
jgi:two-component system cell cycle response regulator